ncbi:MAG: alpha/beta hydrolase [Bacteroidota bacterium]
MSLRIACIPGLGFSPAVYRNLDWGPYQPHFLEWLLPADPDESIEAYARRMLAQIPEEEGELVLIGHSFGGVMAQEMARQAKTKFIILVSSIRSPKEIPYRYRIFAPLGLSWLFIKEPALWTIAFWGPPFGYGKEEQALFREMVEPQSNDTLQWSLKRFSGWEDKGEMPCPSYQIHGTDDRTLHFSMVENPDAVINDGSHLMVYNRPGEVGPLIRVQLDLLSNKK